MSDQWAHSIDSGASMILSMGAASVTQSAQAASYQSFSLPILQNGYYNYLKRNSSKFLIETEEVGCVFEKGSLKKSVDFIVDSNGVTIPTNRAILDGLLIS